MLQEWYSDPPRGRRRHLDPLWSYHVQQYFWPNGDNDWFEYAEWVEQGRGRRILEQPELVRSVRVVNGYCPRGNGW